jgi:Ca2+:H+ antiporter
VFCFAAATLVYVGERLGGGKPEYSCTLAGLAWYIGWPFGKYVSGDGEPKKKSKPSEAQAQRDALEDGDAYGSLERGRVSSESGSSIRTVRDNRTPDYETAGGSRRSSAQVPIEPPDSPAAVSANDYGKSLDERQRLLRHSSAASYGAVHEDDTGKPRSPTDQDDSTTAIGSDDTDSVPRNKVIARCLGLALYWPLLSLVIAPLMLFVCVLCWGMVITIPMAKLTWALLKNMFTRPLEIHFKSAPKIAVPTPTASPATARSEPETGASGVIMRRARLKAGQLAPNVGGDDAVTTVLLCIYRAVGFQYYKYTIGGVNIMFVNLVPLVFFTIFDAFVLLPIAERTESTNKLFHLISSRVFIFVLSLASVIPLSYFIGMAVASISAQSSIGMGAVINATFGSIIEIILYGIALTQGKGRLVEGSIVGSILAGVLLMPGASMVSGAFKRKEQRFNAKSAGVTSTMLIMAIIGTLTPTLFYQTYGSVSVQRGKSQPNKSDPTK